MSLLASAMPLNAAPSNAEEKLLFFIGRGCPHCDDAKPFVASLARDYPWLEIEEIEVRHDAVGRSRFIETMRRLGAQAVGVPTFVAADDLVVGYAGPSTEASVRRLVAKLEAARSAATSTVVATPSTGTMPDDPLVQDALRGDGAHELPLGSLSSSPESPPKTPMADGREALTLPIFGAVDPGAIPLPLFTVAIGLVDGINPCAMWVLIVLLGILSHVRSANRMVLLASVFVVMSGVVYFLFMVAWSYFFALVGLARWATVALGVGLVAMGLVNLKEIFWFKQGVSLMIPESVKPRLYRRMRGVAQAGSTPAAFGGVVVLAFVVNLVELGCTLGLPAAYTRILTLREIPTGGRLAYLALYNVAYVVPLALIVVVFVVLRRRITLGERGAKILKGVSGALLTLFGAIFLLAPDLFLGH